MATNNRNGITSCQVLANLVISDLISNGMVLVQPATFSGTVYRAVLKTSSAINIASDDNEAYSEWYLAIDAETDAKKIRILAGTVAQFGGGVSYLVGPTSRVIGELAAYDGTTNHSFIDRTSYPDADLPSYPMEYILTVTNRGIALAIWEHGIDDATKPPMSYFTIQRSVDNQTGQQRSTGKMPVFCLYGINRTSVDSHHYKFIVKEQDVFVPTIPVRADSDSADVCRSINSSQQIAITEEFNYAVFFPNNLHSQRFVYPQDDLDLIAYTSADVVSPSSTITLPIYNEPAMRNYRALQSTGADQTGMRILILTN